MITRYCRSNVLQCMHATTIVNHGGGDAREYLSHVHIEADNCSTAIQHAPAVRTFRGRARLATFDRYVAKEFIHYHHDYDMGGRHAWLGCSPARTCIIKILIIYTTCLSYNVPRSMHRTYIIVRRARKRTYNRFGIRTYKNNVYSMHRHIAGVLSYRFRELTARHDPGVHSSAGIGGCMPVPIMIS